MASNTVAPPPVITVMTDFGLGDHYVAVLKAVMLRIAPQARIMDISHDIEPFAIQQAAFVLWQSHRWFPPGTVHLVVVDPGVGTARRIVVGQYGEQFVVAPDNGLISFVHREHRPTALHVVENRHFFLPHVGSTFDGRDIMAPVAAHLANGVAPAEFGRPTDRLEVLDVEAQATVIGQRIQGQVLYADRFGNLITNVSAEQLADVRLRDQAAAVAVNGVSIGALRHTFADAGSGEPIAYVGSSRLLEVAVNRGSALERFGAIDQITITVQ